MYFKSVIAFLAFVFWTAAAVAASQGKPPASCISDASASALRIAQRQDGALAAARAAADSIQRSKALLAAMMSADQDIQTVALDITANCHIELDQPAAMPIVGVGRQIGEKNRAELKHMLDTIGWPVLSIYGPDADRAAFLVAQHADREPTLQSRVLELLRPLVDQRETDPENYALLFDRVRVNASQPQRYGSQGGCKGRRWVPDPIEARADLDQRRAQLGLEPMAAYQARVSKLYCRA